LDSRFFPRKTPLGQRVGNKLGIPYRGLTTFFMGDATRQAAGILQSPGQITKAANRAIDAALTSPQPHRYRIQLSLRWLVRYLTKPVVVTLGLIPGVEALVWDIPRAIGSALRGRWREAAMTVTLAALDLFPAVLALFLGILTLGTSLIPVVAVGVVIGWLTEWRYFHPYVRQHYGERDERAMRTMVEALTDAAFMQARASIPASQWARVFPDQVRYTLAITRHADINGSVGAVRQQKLKAAHAQLARQFPHYQQEYQEQRARANALLAATGGKRPSRWRPIMRHRFNDAYGAMLDAYESMEQFRRVNTMHRLLFNAYATRDAMQPDLVRIGTIGHSS
jgi:hypothetical protein